VALGMIYRDDDLSVLACAHSFKELHEKFIQAKQTHTVAVIMKDLWLNHGLFWYIATAPYLEIGLHGWEHKDYSQLSYDECTNDIKKSLTYWKENTERMVKKTKPITTFFAPWNREGENIKKACLDNGLRFCNVRKGEWEGDTIRSFHHWHAELTDFKI
jgi:hypothetical protein